MSVQVVAGVLQVGDRYLLGQRKGARRHEGCWEFPGGKLEPGESEAVALAREWMEELGCSVETVMRLQPYEYTGLDDVPFTLVPYRVKRRSAAQPVAGDSHSSLAWFTLEEIRRLTAVTPSTPFILMQLTTHG